MGDGKEENQEFAMWTFGLKTKTKEKDLKEICEKALEDKDMGLFRSVLNANEDYIAHYLRECAFLEDRFHALMKSQYGESHQISESYNTVGVANSVRVTIKWGSLYNESQNQTFHKPSLKFPIYLLALYLV